MTTFLSRDRVSFWSESTPLRRHSYSLRWNSSPEMFVLIIRQTLSHLHFDIQVLRLKQTTYSPHFHEDLHRTPPILRVANSQPHSSVSADKPSRTLGVP